MRILELILYSGHPVNAKHFNKYKKHRSKSENAETKLERHQNLL